MACEPKPEDGKGVGCVVLGNISQCKGPVAAQRRLMGTMLSVRTGPFPVRLTMNPEVTLSHSGT